MQSDQHLCCSLLRYYVYLLYPKVSRFLLASVAEQAGLNLTWSKFPEDTFSCDVAHLFTIAVEFIKPSLLVASESFTGDNVKMTIIHQGQGD